MADNKIAIIKTGGKQYKVLKGDLIKVEKIGEEVNKNIKIKTLLKSNVDGSDLELGNPFLDNKVEVKIVGGGKAKKVNVVKYKNKTRYKRNIGHRQPYSEIEITQI